MMTLRTSTLEELQERSLDEALRSAGDRPKPILKPLPRLEGFIAEGWKDAIYVPTGGQAE